ncbi:gliding motility lipoprotein GldH [Eudoraea chungangensis]|uniref:gliding motility lipoprotein GldH n=1 Tax=Eudoraea chungangensis TaxID=1481905 RepID=UPI0023EBCA54|nr:gliding motility lipoprotein GldH [Eudoraea chungangensis]
MPRTLLYLLLLWFFISCNDKLVVSEYQANPSGIWAKDDVKQFAFTPMDTINSYDLFIDLRNDDSFAYSNLFIIADLTDPNGKVQRDTIEFQMAAPDGQWLGKGLGSIKENKLWYKENVNFTVNGVYMLELSHAMRKNGDAEGIVNLAGITDVGFSIEKHK